MFARHLETRLLEALSDTPVVFLQGARQTGKSTLVRELAAGPHPARYLTLDDAGVLAAAESDPQGFLAGIEGDVVLDEVQRVPGLFPAIKLSVDRDRRPGRFLLTGSADILLVPDLSESLAGRVELLTLWPLSQGELLGRRERFVDRLFGSGHLDGAEPTDRADLAARVLAGGYPEAVSRRREERRQAWFGAYVTTILQRDVRDLAAIEGLGDLPRLLALAASRTGSPLNFAELSRASGVPQTTLKRYLVLLETTFLLHRLPPWSPDLGKRLVRSPEHFLVDSGLLAHLQGIDSQRLAADPDLWGKLLESFVVQELSKQIGWSATRASAFHLRTQTGIEVDVVLEDAAGRCAGIEVKAGATLGERDFRGLRFLADQLGERFVRGVLLYTGREAVPFGEKLVALPIAALWS